VTQPTTSLPATATTATAAPSTSRPGTTGACPLAAIGGGATEVTAKPGDFDGNRVADTLRAYKLTGQWHLRVELAGGTSGGDLVVPDVDPATGLKAVGGFNIDENLADEAFAIVGSGASTTEVAIFTFTNCKLARVTANGRTIVFVIGATAQRRSGLSCVTGTALQVLSATAPPNTGTPFTASRTTFDLVGSDLVQANTSPPEMYGLDDPRLAPFARFDCGSLSLS